jgi:hypothetical protein
MHCDCGYLRAQCEIVLLCIPLQLSTAAKTTAEILIRWVRGGCKPFRGRTRHGIRCGRAALIGCELCGRDRTLCPFLSTITIPPSSWAPLSFLTVLQSLLSPAGLASETLSLSAWVPLSVAACALTCAPLRGMPVAAGPSLVVTFDRVGDDGAEIAAEALLVLRLLTRPDTLPQRPRAQPKRVGGIVLGAGTLARTPRDSAPCLAPHRARVVYDRARARRTRARREPQTFTEQGAHALRFALTRPMLTRSRTAGRPVLCVPVVEPVAAADTTGQASRSGRRRAKTRSQRHFTRSPSLRSDATRCGPQERAASCSSTTSACDTLGAALGAVAGNGPGCAEYCTVFFIQ